MKAVLLNNRYRILQTLGRGGFGETYLTEDTHMPSGRKCVLKQLKPVVKNPKTPLWIKERFQREAAILEELGQGSDQIPRLYAYFSEDDKFYLVQEWIEGLTLDQYWEKEGNLHRDEVKEILLQLLPVLDYVHSRRIIHRDIKPENIILRQGDNLPFLIDFGAVKEAIATEISEDSGSSYSASIGTPGYMSSEQAAGRPIYSSDLYSLGLTAIFLLTGKSPHELETNPRDGEIIWLEHAHNLDRELTQIIDRSIRFHPRDRFSTAQEMLSALLNGAKGSDGTKSTGITLNVAPGGNSNKSYSAKSDRYNTIGINSKKANQPKKRSLLTNLSLFVLIAIAVAGGTFAAGFAIISSILRSPQSPTQQAEIKPTPSRPDIFVNPEINPEKPKANTEKEKPGKEENFQKAEKILTNIREKAEQLPAKNAKQPEGDNKTPKTLTKIDVDSRSEINIPILTTGISESQLVSTLGKPNSERKGFRPDSRVLVYYDVVPDRVNLSYESDNTGKIRQTDVVLDSSVSLGTMQQTLAKMLGGDTSADIKDKLRSVYNRQTNFSFFKVDNLEGKVQRDSKDRVSISVWERGFQ
ncbi:serine/threonine protein kinase [Waterburya agarophytonicola K14]|uniref:non-specific serine/threonine protein kinase n=1 Tax=Waterburya agarophytonicola KI4 TaxID=2874699 RepID=A0A964BRE9_9CYAN|nr:serine/threonine-protein kinase [Waterburya agarophytonicola]MCC0177501.1 serine/threonine protein kinase [Waterburya agarophytonicola KI4]